MELVAGVADALPPNPAERGAYVRRQRFGHQRVVPDRHHVFGRRAPERPPGGGGQQCPRRPDPAVRGGHHHPGAVGVQIRGRRVLEDAYAEPLGGRGQAPGQPGRIDQRHPVRVVDGRQIGGRRDLGLHLVPVQQPPVQPEATGQLVLLRQGLDLPVGHRHIQLAGPLEVAGDAVPSDRGLDRLQGLEAHPQQDGQLVGEPLLAIAQPVGQAGRAESAVTAGRTVGDPPGLEKDDVAPRPFLRGLHRGPQPGEPAADDHQVGLHVLDQPPAGRGPLRPVQPVRLRRCVGQHPGRVVTHARTLVADDLPPGRSVGSRDVPAPARLRALEE